MICKQCGKKLKRHDKFCSNCGLPVGAEPPKDEPVDVEAEDMVLPSEDQTGADEETKTFGFEAPGDAFDWNVHTFPGRAPKRTQDIDFDWKLDSDEFKNVSRGRDEVAFAPEPYKAHEAQTSDAPDKELGGASLSAKTADSAESSVQDFQDISGHVQAEADSKIEQANMAGPERRDETTERDTEHIKEPEHSGEAAENDTKSSQAKDAETDNVGDAGTDSPGKVPPGYSELTEHREGDITGEALEREIFGGAVAPGMVDEGKGLSRQTAKIDKFYTFNGKNEEFQKLFDQEVEKFKDGRPLDQDTFTANIEEIRQKKSDYAAANGGQSETVDQIEEMARARAILFGDLKDIEKAKSEDRDASETDGSRGDMHSAGDGAFSKAGAGVDAEPSEIKRDDSSGFIRVNPPAASEADWAEDGEKDFDSDGEQGSGPSDIAAQMTELSGMGMRTQDMASEKSEAGGVSDVGETTGGLGDEMYADSYSAGDEIKTDEGAAGERVDAVDGAAEQPEKKGSAGKVVIAVLSVVLLFFLACFALKVAAPDSAAGKKVDEYAQKIMNIFTSDDEPEAIEIDKSKFEGNLTAAIQTVIDSNYKGLIETIKYDESLAYDKDQSYSDSGVTNSTEIKNNVLYTSEDGEKHYVDVTMLSTVIEFCSKEEAMKNNGDTAVLKTIDEKSSLYQTVKKESETATKEVLSELSIGDIRAGKDGTYYVWVKEVRENPASEKTGIYEITADDNNEMQITDYIAL